MTDSKALNSFLKAQVEEYEPKAGAEKWGCKMALLAASTQRRYFETVAALWLPYFGRRLDYQIQEPHSKKSPLEVIKSLGRGMYADILLMATYLRGMPIADVIRLKKAQFPHPMPQIAAIIARNSLNPRQEYVFQLNQSQERDGAILRAVTRRTDVLLKQCGETSADDAVLSAWIEAAQQVGISDRAILGAISRVPKTHRYLSALRPAEFNDDETVANAIVDYAPRWYLIKLKKQANSREKSAKAIISLLRSNETFYPYRELVRRIGSRLKAHKEPLIAEYLFLKASPQNLTDIRLKIMDHGCLHRNYSDPARPYSTISLSKMASFQRSVGQFSCATTAVETLDSYSEGDIVRLRGELGSQLFEIVEIRGMRHLILAATGSLPLVIHTTPDKINHADAIV